MRVTAAAEQRDIPALRALLEAGANPNERDEDGTTRLTGTTLLWFSDWWKQGRK